MVQHGYIPDDHPKYNAVHEVFDMETSHDCHVKSCIVGGHLEPKRILSTYAYGFVAPPRKRLSTLSGNAPTRTPRVTCSCRASE